jgi:hypothetical protein
MAVAIRVRIDMDSLFFMLKSGAQEQGLRSAFARKINRVAGEQADRELG